MLFFFCCLLLLCVPNRRELRNKRAGLYTYMVCIPTWIVYLHGLYTYMVCIPMTNFEHTNTNKRAGWNKHAGGNLFSKLINVHACLFDTLE